MISQLQTIKPKRIKESLDAILLPHFIVLEFGITQVVIPCDTGFPASVINHKELYTFEYDTAIQIAKYPEPKFDHKWEECIITAADATAFSSFSASGDDEYFIGTLEIDNSLKLTLYGFTYYANWAASKLRNGSKLFYNIDYQVYYYLFQMFKNLSGKKTDKLLWVISNGDLVLTNEAKTFYIICSQNDKNYRFKTKNIPLLKEFFEKDTGSERQLFKEVLGEVMVGGGSFPIGKHLMRPLADPVNYSVGDKFHKLRSDGYTLCLCKDKP